MFRPAFIVALVALHGFVTSAPLAAEPEVVDYDYVKLLVDTSDAPNLVDVREPFEHAEAHIPRSVNIPLGTVAAVFTLDPGPLSEGYGLKVDSRDDEIVFYCKTGVRSLQAAIAAQNAGYRNVKYYKGSMREWLEKNPTK